MGETEKILQSCDDCGACIKNCIFLSHYCKTPKDLAGRFLRDPLKDIETAYSCTLCGLCRRVCHLNLYPGDMYLEARREIFRALQAKTLPEAPGHRAVLPKLKAIGSHQAFSTSPLFTLSKGPSAGNGTVPKTVFFPGCSFPAYSPGLVVKSYRYLRGKIPGTGIVLNCCGKPSRDMGDEEKFHTIFRNTMEEFSRLGVEEVVVACINCHKVFAENSSMRIRTIYELMTEMGFPKSVSGQGRKVSIHDVCPARYTPGIRSAVREIVTRLDYEIAEMPFRNEVTSCCGAGGCAPCGNADLSDRHSQKRVDQAKGRIVTYCAHCRERISSYASSLHVLDLVFRDPGRQHGKKYNKSWKNWLNRWYLKHRLRVMS